MVKSPATPDLAKIAEVSKIIVDQLKDLTNMDSEAEARGIVEYILARYFVPPAVEMECGTVVRQIDPKFHICPHGHIIKTSSGEIVPEWEPLILQRSRDHLLLPLLRHYRQLCVLDGCNDYQLGMLDQRIAEFERFAKEHPEWMKQPGITRGAAFVPTSAPPHTATDGQDAHFLIFGQYEKEPMGCCYGEDEAAHARQVDLGATTRQSDPATCPIHNESTDGQEDGK